MLACVLTKFNLASLLSLTLGASEGYSSCSVCPVCPVCVCVCVCVCVSVSLHAILVVRAITNKTKDTIVASNLRQL